MVLWSTTPLCNLSNNLYVQYSRDKSTANRALKHASHRDVDFAGDSPLSHADPSARRAARCRENWHVRRNYLAIVQPCKPTMGVTGRSLQLGKLELRYPEKPHRYQLWLVAFRYPFFLQVRKRNARLALV